MPELIHNMQYALQMAGGNVGFTALFLAGLFALWNNKFDHRAETGQLFWFAAITLIVIISPLYLFAMDKIMPEAKASNMYLWILPTTPVILYVGVRAFGYTEKIWDKIFLTVGMIALLFLAALTSYNQSSHNLADNGAYIPEEEYTVIQEIDKYREEMRLDHVLIWGDKDVMMYSRVYSGHLYTLYSKDLWLGTVDNQLHQVYEDWYYTAYNQMENAWAYVDEIGTTAEEQGCDILVFDADLFTANDIELQDVITGGYSLYYIDDNYYVYAK